MKNVLVLVSLVLLTVPAWSQGAKGVKPAPNPSNLTQFGFTDAEAAAVQEDLRAWEQGNRDADAQSQVLVAQRNQVLVAATPDRATFERLTRSLFDLPAQRDLVRFDLIFKWRAAYGIEKARTLEGMLRDGAPAGPGGAPKTPAKR